MIRTALVFAIGVLAACEGGKGGRFPDGGGGGPLPDGREKGITPAPIGGGFCCPIEEVTCDCFRNGGWIQRETDMCPAICDLAPINTSISVDEHGCQQLFGPDSCLGPPPPIVDAAL